MNDPGAQETTVDGSASSQHAVAGADADAGHGVMPAIARTPSLTRLQRVSQRVWSALVAAWGAFIGLLPHVLHHVGPLAGAALLAGAAGTALFAAIGAVAATPFLLRLYRRFGTWRAPAIALAVFAVMFSLSSFVIGPAIAGDGKPASPQPGIEQPAGHDEHH